MSADSAHRGSDLWLGLVTGAILLIGSVAGFVALAGAWNDVLAFDLAGQRTEGVVVTLPILTALAGILLLVRGIVVGARAAAGSSSETASIALGGAVALLVVGILALAGLLVLAAVARPADPTGLALLIQVGAVLAAVGLAALVTGIRALRHPVTRP